MISFESTSLSFFFLLLLAMSIDFNFKELKEYATHLLICLMQFPGISTGLGIVFGNGVINFIKHKNSIKDISKVFDLIVSNQIDDLYNIQIANKNIRNRLITHAGTIIGSQNGQNINVPEPERTVEERKGLLKDINKIKDRESIIRNDDLYKRKLDDIKMFKSSNLKVLVRYFRKLKFVLEDLRNFTSYDLPDSIDDFSIFNQRKSEICKDRANFLIARINVVICLGLMTKSLFNLFDENAKKKFKDVYKQLLLSSNDIQDDRSIYSILRDDFDTIQEFAQKNEIKITCDVPITYKPSQ